MRPAFQTQFMLSHEIFFKTMKSMLEKLILDLKNKNKNKTYFKIKYQTWLHILSSNRIQ